MKNNDQEKLQDIARYALNGIRELVERRRSADTEEEIDAAIDAIYKDPLSIEVRDGWRNIGSKDPGNKEFRILLSTGGPATRIFGDLDEHDEPCNVRLQAQDWFMPWTDYETEEDDDEILLEYCQTFCFHE